MSEKYVHLDKVPERLRALEAATDPATFRRIKGLGLSLGWRCWEVGAGSGSVAYWLSEQVGDQGNVLATDINLGLMEGLSKFPNIALLRHDIDKDDPLPGSFDLIHTRLVLMHGGIDRPKVIKKLISVLKPGGWLLLEEHDKYGTFTFLSENLAFAKALYMLTKSVEANGGSLSWARSLPTVLEKAGLIDVQGEIDAPFFRGGSPYARFWGYSFQELRNQIMNQGMTAEEVSLAIAEADDRRLWLSCHAMIAAWGRKS